MRFVAQNCKRLAVFLGRAIGTGQGDFGFALQDGNRSAEFVGGVGYEAALLLERFFQAIEEFVEGKSERAEFIAGIGNFKAFAEAGGAHAASLGGHIGYGGEALSGEEIAAGAGKEQRDR